MAAKFSSVVIAPAQIALGVVSGIVLALILEALDSDLWPAAILVLLAVSALGYFLATVSVEIDDTHITIGQGRREKNPHVYNVREVREGEVRSLSWLQCFGIGIETDEQTTRFTVRPGPNLILTLRDGGQVRVTVVNPVAALDALPFDPVPLAQQSEVAEPTLSAPMRPVDAAPTTLAPPMDVAQPAPPATTGPEVAKTKPRPRPPI